MYRILDGLVWGSGRRLEKGSLDALDGVSTKIIRVLCSRGLISEVSAPPLKILPGWEQRAQDLAAEGVNDVNDLLEANLAELAMKLETPVEELEKSAVEALAYIR